MTWTVDLVEKRLAEAAGVLRRSTAPDARFRRGARSAMPAYVQETQTSYGYTAVETGVIRPSPAELARLDQVQDWLTRFAAPAVVPRGLPPDLAKVLWAKASGIAVSKIIAARWLRYGVAPAQRKKGGKSPVPSGNSRTAVHAIYQRGLAHLCDSLNSHDVPVVKAVR